LFRNNNVVNYKFLIRCPNHEKLKSGEWENEYAGDQIGTSKNYCCIILGTKEEFGTDRKIVRNNGQDTIK
jgi:hypothetical protein